MSLPDSLRVLNRRAIRLGPAGRWLALTSVAYLLCGLVAARPVLTFFGALAILALLWSAASARLVLGRMRRGGLRVEVDGSDLPLRVSVDRTLVRDVRLVGPWIDHLQDLHLIPGPTGPLQAEVSPHDGGWQLAMRSPRMGYGWLQGFHLTCSMHGGLLTARTWMPMHLPLTVLPVRFPVVDRGTAQSGSATLQVRDAARRPTRHGFGMEFRELRDHQAGDPFKHIAWPATARRGKLTTRVYESDVRQSAWVLLDVSASMFWGKPGQARIDYALETAFQVVTTLIESGDRAGLLVHDEDVRILCPPAGGRRQLYRILESLLEVPHLVHEDATETTLREILEGVATWFQVQEGRSFRLPPQLREMGWIRHGEYDEARLVAASRDHLTRLREEPTSGRFVVPTDAYASDHRQSTLRAMCRHVGIPLPRDPVPKPGGQARGLARAIHAVLASKGGPHTLLVVSDLHTADQLDALRRAALGARRHHHNVVVLCPADPAFADDGAPADDALSQALAETENLRVDQGLAAVEAFLRPAGVHVLRCSPEEAVPRLLQRLSRVA